MEYKKIIIFQWGHLGDFFVSLPFLRNIRYHCPDSHITLVVGEWNKQIALTIPEIDDIQIFNHFFLDRKALSGVISFIQYSGRFIRSINDGHYDLGIDLRGYINTMYPLLFSNIKTLAGFSYKHQGVLLDIQLPVTETTYEAERLLSLLPSMGLNRTFSRYDFSAYPFDELAVESFFKETGINQDDLIIGIFPGAPFLPRRWPAINYAVLIDKLVETIGCKIIILGGPDDQQTVSEVKDQIRNQAACLICTDVITLMTTIKHCSIFISNDTGPMHIAISLGIPSISLFGPGNRKRWGINHHPHYTLYSLSSCSPCLLKSDTCDNPEEKCMEKISVDAVYETVCKVISELSFGIGK